MAEKASNKCSHFVLPDARYNQAVAPMPEVRVIETRVAGEKRRIAVLAQQNDNLLILQTLATEIDSNLPRRQPPCI